MSRRPDAKSLKSRLGTTRTLTLILIATLTALVVTLGALVVTLALLVLTLDLDKSGDSQLPNEPLESSGQASQSLTDDDSNPNDSEPEEQPTEIPQPETIQEMIDLASAGDTVRVPSGIYREAITVNKPITLSADPGAEIRGSDVWENWSRSGIIWVSSDQLPEFNNNHGYCESSVGDRCKWQEQVFLDGIQLDRVESGPESGEFAVSSERQIALGDDPDGKLVEVSVRQFWVSGESADVTIEGFTMKHAANRAQTGALSNNGFDDWTIRDNSLSHAHGANVSLNGARNLVLENNDIGYGGQLGVHGSEASDVQVRSNHIHNNNVAGYSTGWEAGGLKMAIVTRTVFDDNESFSNQGPGLWCDIDCDDVTFSNNRVYLNASSGISYEISRNARIYGNVVWENANEHRPWGWGAGIRVQNSRDTEVYDNIVAWNGDGISVISQDRGDDDWNQVVNNTVRNNSVFSIAIQERHDYALAWLEDWDGVLTDPASNNQGAANAYYHWNPDDANNVFAWGDDEFRFDQIDRFNRTPGDQDSRELTTSEKNRLLNSVGVPTSPEPR